MQADWRCANDQIGTRLLVNFCKYRFGLFDADIGSRKIIFLKANDQCPCMKNTQSRSFADNRLGKCAAPFGNSSYMAVNNFIPGMPLNQFGCVEPILGLKGVFH